jgi:hypothetical protein
MARVVEATGAALFLTVGIPNGRPRANRAFAAAVRARVLAVLYLDAHIMDGPRDRAHGDVIRA